MKSYIVLFLSFFVITSCSTTNDDGSDETPFEFPFKVGNEWVMEIDNERRTVLDTLSVVKDTLIGENTWYYLQAIHSHPRSILNVSFEGYYTTTKSGIYKYKGEPTVSDNIPFLITNLDVGDSYVNDFNSVWTTTFLGSKEDQNYGLLYEYEFEYTSITRGSYEYVFDKSYKFGRLVSPEKGFIKWESGYFGLPKGTKDTTITLTLSDRVDISLKEFVQAE